MGYKLTYFDGHGRAETARMLFKLAGKNFEDCRVDSDQWAKLKPKTPFGQIPILEMDGVTLCQSNAINRTLARQFGLAGKSVIDQARVDMVLDCIIEIDSKMDPVLFAKDDATKATEGKKFKEETLQPHFTKLQKVLEMNNGGNGFFVGKEVTVADVFLVGIGGVFMQLAGGPIWSDYPKLDALKKKVEALPKIAAWIKIRPQ